MKSSVVHPLAVGVAVLLGYLPVSVRADILYTSTISSIDQVPSSGVPTTLTTASLNNPQDVAFSLSGTLYVANFGSNSIEKFSQTGADLGALAISGPALSGPVGMAFDGAGNLYVANQGNNTIEKISTNGTSTIIVPATAGLTTPSALAFDSAGNLYVASYGADTIQKFSATGVALGTFASGSTVLSGPDGLAFDAAGNLYAANAATNTIEEFTSTGTPSLFASTNLSTPIGLAFDSAGNLYAANSGNGTVEKFTASKTASLFASGFGFSSPEYLAFTTNSGLPVLGSSSILASLQYWNGSVTSPNGLTNGGTEAWDNTTTNWTNAAGSSSAAWGSTSGVFAGTAGTVTLGANISFNTIEFQTDGYVVNRDAGNLFSLKPVGNANVISDAGVTATINAPLTGTGSLTKAGGGTLILGGANTYTGATIISSGTLLAGTGFTIPSASAVLVDTGAIFDLNSLSQTVASIADGPDGGGTISLGSGILTTGGGNTSNSFSGAIQDGGVSGQTEGSLTKVGTGTLTLSGINTYTGPTTISAGAVQFAQTTSLYDTTSTTTVNADAHNLIVASSATAIFNVGGTGEFTPSQLLALAALGSATGGFESGSTIGIDTTNAPGTVVLSSGIANPNGGANVLNVTKYGAGALTFGAVNTYTGNTTIAAGELITTVAGALPSGTSLSLGTGNSAVPGELDLFGTNQTIRALGLTPGNTGGTGNIITSTNGPATLTFGAGTSNFAGLITGPISLVKGGTSNTVVNLGAANTYTGSTTIDSGQLRIGVNNALPVTTTLTVGEADGQGLEPDFFLVHHNQTLAALNIVAGYGTNATIDVQGGVLTLNGNVTVVNNTTLPGFGGASFITDSTGGGALDLGNATRTFNVAGQESQGQDLQISAVIRGNGGVVINATPSSLDASEGGVAFGAANAYTGSTTVAQGRLTTTVSGALPATTDLILGTANSALAGDVDLSSTSQTINSLSVANLNTGGAGNFITSNNGPATLMISSTTTNSTFGNLLTGQVSLIKAGAGTTLTLTSTNSYTGTTTVNAGALSLTGSINGGGAVIVNGGTLALAAGGSIGATSAVGVNFGGTLTGTGTANGTVTVASGGNLSPGGATPGTLTVGSLVLNAGANSNFRLATAGTVGGGINDLVNVTGNLTLGGNLNVTTLAGFGLGSYTLFTYGGTLTNSGFSAININGNYTTTIVTGVAGEVDLTVSAGTSQYWDGTGTINNGVISGGSGNWSATANNWTSFDGSVNSMWQNGTAVFAAPGGTVTLTSPISTLGLTFGSTGYVIAGTNTLTLLGPTPTISVTAAGNSATIGVKLAGTAGLTANGAGTLILTNGANSYTGGTTIRNGTVQIGTATAMGSLGGGAISVNTGGTLALVNTTGNALSANISNGVGGVGTVSVNSKNTNTLFGALTDGAAGQLALLQSGVGTTILTNSGNTFSGATTVSAGVLQVGTTALPGSIGASSAVSVGTGGTLSLINVTGNIFGNNVTGGPSGTGLLSINSTKNLTLSGALSDGAGPNPLALTKLGTGTATLSGNSTYSGATTVSAGTLQIGNGAGSFNPTGNVTVASGATLAVDLPDTASIVSNIILNGATSSLKTFPSGATNTLDGVISGTGSVTQSGTGTTVLFATETYTGATTVTAGTLEIDGALAAASTVAVGTAGKLTGSGTIHGKATLTGNGAIDLTSTGIIGGTLAVTGGNWNGDGTVTGLVTSSSGVFNINGDFTTTAGLSVTGGTIAGMAAYTGSLNYASTASSTFGGAIAGTGAAVTMNKAASTLTLTGANTYTGATTVSAGTLQLGDGTTTGSTLGTGPVTVSGTGVLAINLSDSSTFAPNVTLSAAGATLKVVGSETNMISGVISGLGGFTQSGTGITALTNNETYTGVTNVTAGILEVDDSLAAGSIVNVGTAGTLRGTGTIHGKATLTGGGTISFSTGGNIGGALTITGGNWIGVGSVGGAVTSSSGNFNLSGTLTAPAGLTVTGGTIAGNGALAGKLNYMSSASSTFTGIIEDGAAPSTVIMNHASSTLILTGTNSYTGATTISAGTLQLGDGSTTGTTLGSGAVTASGTGILALNLPDTSTFARNISVTAAGATVKMIQAGTNTLSGVISGLGGLNQNGTGTTIVTGAQTYTGVTSVTGGTLQVDSSLAAGSTVNVAAGGTLAGLGTIGGPVNVLAGGTLSAGDSSSPGLLTVGKLVLSAGSNSDFRLAAPAGVNDQVKVNGNLTLAGNLSVTALPGFGMGSYNLFNYTGTLTNTGFIGINGTAGYTVQVVTGVLHEVSLQVNSVGVVTQYWDGTGTTANNIISGGSGTWNNTTTNWTLSDGSANATWKGGVAVFDAPGGTVTLAAPINAQGLTFGSTSYTIAGASTLNLVGTTTVSPTISVSNAGTTATISAPITGNAGLNANGAGTLILTSTTNSYTGETNVTTGTVQIGTPAAAGSIGDGTISIASNGTLSLVNLHGNALANNVTDNTAATTGTLIASATTANTLSGALTDGAGQLALTQNGTGTTTLTNAGNTFSGATTISKGTLQIGSATAAGSLGATSTVAVGPSATLSLVNVAGNILGNSINAVSGTGLVNVNSTGSNTLSGALTNGAGTLALTQSGTGMTVLTGSDTYTGATTVSAGTLQVGNGAIGTIASASTVTVNGTGTLATDLADTSVFSNSVVLNAAGASLKPVQTGTNTISGVISGTGVVKQSGTGTTILTAANTYKGGTTVSSGTLLVNNTTGSGTGTGAVAINSGGTLGGTGAITGATTLNSGGTLFPGAGSAGTPGTTLRAASLMWNGGGTLELQLGAVGDELVLTGALTKGTVGAYTIDILDTVGGITGSSYTLATFASSTFIATSFTLDMPGNYTAHLVKTATSLILDVDSGSGQAPAYSEGADVALSGDSGGTPTQTIDSGSTLSITPTPEPGSALLLAFGGAGLLGWRRRRG